jgi:hypothetical protein
MHAYIHQEVAEAWPEENKIVRVQASVEPAIPRDDFRDMKPRGGMAGEVGICACVYMR